MPVFFYPHAYLRDRQLDVIRRWPADQVVNPEIAQARVGSQVGRSNALAGRMARSWKQRLPLPNIKRRPSGLAPADVVYVWGGLMATGPFIIDMDNPYCLVGYNIPAMGLWRPLFRRILRSPRCLEIRCLSEACRRTLGILMGPTVAAKATVHYPRLGPVTAPPLTAMARPPRFLFVGTQFEIKGGPALLNAFRKVSEAIPGATLDIITHLPPEYADLARQAGVTVHHAKFGRDEIWRRFMMECDVLVHPTYVESFGMVALEAIAHGMAVIATDVYALKEMVEDGRNGVLLQPPLSLWRGDVPSPLYRHWEKAAELCRKLEPRSFEHELARSMIVLGQNPSMLMQQRRASLELYASRFLDGKINTLSTDSGRI